MSASISDSAILLLADGTLLEGSAFGFRGTVFGEVVFNTGMTGYQEVITDPSYFGQLVTFTFPELGNTGVNITDQESLYPHLKGVIAREVNSKPSNWRSEQSLESWLDQNGVVGIKDVDTRALVRHLRKTGAMNGVISSEDIPIELLFEQLHQFPSMEGLNLVEKVTTKVPYKWTLPCPVGFDQRLAKQSDSAFCVVAIDFGIKRSILDRLVAHGCQVTVLPATSSLDEILRYKPEGVFLSNGPGDPAAVDSSISLVKELIEKVDIPLFGICLGHQILGLALGGSTFKLLYGHRGLNHPCGNKGRVEITSQNHGFALDPNSFRDSKVLVTHFNLNDLTVAAIAVRDRPLLGVQYHPEASPGPHDADHHFSRFVSLMAERR